MKLASLISVIATSVLLGNPGRIQKALEKRDFEKAQELIIKAYEKEPNNPGISYYKAVLFNTKAFKNFSLDTARVAIKKSLLDFEKTKSDVELLEDLKDDGFSKVLMDSLFIDIQAQLFESTTVDISLEKIEQFKVWYPNSVYESTLEFKIDSILFEKSKVLHTVDGYSEYKKQRPNSTYFSEADSLLNKLAFDELTNTRNVALYKDFLEEFPNTPYRAKVEDFLLKNTTLNHSKNEYLEFLKYAKTIKARKKALDILFYIDGAFSQYLHFHPENDSLSKAFEIQKEYVFPASESKAIGLYSISGKQLMASYWDQIETDIKCQISADEWVFVKKDMVGFISTKNSKLILKNVEGYEDLGNGVALVQKKNGNYLYHKSGFILYEKPIENAEILQGKWIKIKENGKWGLISFLGINFTKAIFDDIYLLGSLWAFKKDGLIALESTEYITDNLTQYGLILEYKFEDLELINGDKILGFRDNRECLLDTALNFLIPWGEYIINPYESGWYTKSEKGYQLVNTDLPDIKDTYFAYLETNDGWIALKNSSDWMLVSKNESLPPTQGYDSVKLINDFAAITFVDKSRELVFKNGTHINLSDNVQLKRFDENDNHLLIEENGYKTILDNQGNKVLKKRLTEIKFFNDTLLITQYRGKYGLLNLNSNYLIEPTYDFIGENDDLILLLKGEKIGCFDLQNEATFRPEYDQKIQRIGSFYTASKNGKFGLMNQKKEVLLAFEYDQIQYWNDSSFLVTNDGTSQVIGLNNEVYFNDLDNMELIAETANSKTWTFIQSGKYGMINNQYGTITNPEFSEILNIGTASIPFYFADQHLLTAGYHVVSYLNQRGELVISKPYTRSTFDRLICDDD